MFYACITLIGSLEGGKNLRVGIFLNKHLLGLQETNNCFLGLNLILEGTHRRGCRNKHSGVLEGTNRWRQVHL